MLTIIAVGQKSREVRSFPDGCFSQVSDFTTRARLRAPLHQDNLERTPQNPHDPQISPEYGSSPGFNSIFRLPHCTGASTAPRRAADECPNRRDGEGEAFRRGDHRENTSLSLSLRY